MAVVVEQKSRVGRFDVNFGLDLWCSVLASSGPSGETMLLEDQQGPLC